MVRWLKQMSPPKPSLICSYGDAPPPRMHGEHLWQSASHSTPAPRPSNVVRPQNACIRFYDGQRSSRMSRRRLRFGARASLLSGKTKSAGICHNRLRVHQPGDSRTVCTGRVCVPGIHRILNIDDIPHSLLCELANSVRNLSPIAI